MSHSPFTPETADALAAGRALRVRRAEERRKVAALSKLEAIERCAAIVEGDRPEALDGIPVERLLRSIKSCGVTKMRRVLALAAEHLNGWPIREDARLEDLTPRQRWGLALALRDVAEWGWSA